MLVVVSLSHTPGFFAVLQQLDLELSWASSCGPLIVTV